MYVPYQCCQKSLEDHYVYQTGSGLNYYQGSPYQRGYGLGGLFRSFFRAAAPLFKSGAKAIGKQVFHSGVNLMNDISQGQDFRGAAKRRFKEAGKVLTDKAADKVKSMIGNGERRHKKRKLMKKPVIRRVVKKKCTTPDIFS